MSDSRPGSTGRIFISYRRQDASYPAGWLYDKLADRFGAKQVFKDVDSIRLGDIFAETVAEAVGSCDVVLAVIGKKWVRISGPGRVRRLDDPSDFVRLEIEAAIERKVMLIPILVDGMTVPRPDELPPSISALVSHQALELRPDRFSADTDHLLDVVDDIVRPRRARRKRILIAAGAVAAVVVATLLVALIPDWGRDEIGDEKVATEPESSASSESTTSEAGLSCWDGTTVPSDQNCASLESAAGLKWAFEWNSDFAEPTCAEEAPGHVGELENYKCTWGDEDFGEDRGYIRLRLWRDVAAAQAFGAKGNPAPDDFRVTVAESGDTDVVGSRWAVTSKLVGGGQSSAHFYVYDDLPMSATALGKGETLKDAEKNRDAVDRRFLAVGLATIADARASTGE